MKVINLGESNSVLQNFVSEIRDKKIQKDPLRFRRNLERIGEIFSYEISKNLNYQVQEVTTPLGIANVPHISDKVVLATILRAGLPLQNGLLNFFDGAQSAFVAAYRKYDKGGTPHTKIEYCTSPKLDDTVLILADTMLATGASLEMTYEHLLENGTPLSTHFVCPISSQFAVDYLKKAYHGRNITLWTAAIDEELTNRSYIIPGLGDAGDLAFGNKL